MKLLRSLEKRSYIWFLVVVSLLFFLLRLPSLFEPYWYGDEGIYETMGLALSRGALLYKEIWDNKPPLLYVLYGIFAGDQFSLRVLSLVFGIVSTILFFLLSQKLLTGKRPYIATLIFAFFFATPLIEGNIANAENFMLLFIISAGLLVFNHHTLHNKQLLFAGILSSIAFLFKVVGIFDFSAFLAFLIIINFKNLQSILELVKKLFPYLVGFITPIVISGLYFLIVGTFPEFYQGAFTHMVGYVGYGNYFLFPQGLLIIKLLFLSMALLILLVKRNTIPKEALFILCWLFFSIFNAFFAQRPYTHYLLVLLPSFSLLTAYMLEVSEKKRRFIYGVLFVGTILLVSNSFNLYNKTISYYSNFFSFVNHKQDLFSYYAFFDRNTPRDYQVAQFITMNTNSNDPIFIWGNNAQVYKLANKLPPGRFTVAYHITATPHTLAETKAALEKQNPKFIIITSIMRPEFPYSLSNYSHRINIEHSAIYERNN